MRWPGRVVRKASVRAKVEHPFLIVKRDLGSPSTAVLHVLFASPNWPMQAMPARGPSGERL